MSAVKEPRLETAIRAHLAPCLREDGFSGSGRTFRRVRDSWVQVVNVQGSRWGGSFAINLGLHPVMLPDVIGNVVDPKKITESLCEFRRRLSESGADQWWDHAPTEEGMSAAMAQAAKVYVTIGRPLLEQLSGPLAPMNTVSPDEFASGQFDFRGFGTTKVRMALVLARLRRVQGRALEAASFARFGLAHVNSSFALRRELEELASMQCS